MTKQNAHGVKVTGIISAGNVVAHARVREGRAWAVLAVVLSDAPVGGGKNG